MKKKGKETRKEKTKSFFRTVMKSGDLFSSKHLSLRAVKGVSSVSGIRVIVSKKVASKASSRNRLRRRIRGIFEEINPKSLPKSLEVIFYTKTGSSELPFKELREEIICLVKKVGAN